MNKAPGRVDFKNNGKALLGGLNTRGDVYFACLSGRSYLSPSERLWKELQRHDCRGKVHVRSVNRQCGGDNFTSAAANREAVLQRQIDFAATTDMEEEGSTTMLSLPGSVVAHARRTAVENVASGSSS